MKKSTQDNLDFDMIDLDETAGWNRLEIEAALTEQTDVEDNVFRGEITYEEDGFEEAEYHEAEYYEEDGYEAEYYEEVPVVVPKKKKTKTGKSSKTGKKSSKSSNTSKGAKGKTRKKSKRNETLWDKVAASFREMTLLDGVVAATGVIVLAVAVITVSVFSSAKAAERQVAAFAPIGEDMSYLVDAGRGTLIAMADSDHWVTALEEETEEETVDFEYEEKELEETKTVNVNMKLTSVQKDLKIKFVNYKTGKLISNVKFEVSITDANKKTREYTDDDKDGIIYLKDMAPGKATVTMLVLSGEEGYAFNTAPQTVKIKDKIEYTKIDVAEEVKSESEVNAAVEDTAKENEIEGELKDTVEWVASSKETVNSTDSYEKVDKGNIPNPADLVKAFVRMTESVVESSQQPSSEEPKQDPPKQEVEEPSSPQPSSEPEVQNPPKQEPPKQDPTDSSSSQPSTEPSKQEPTEPSKQPTTEAPKPTTEATKPSTEAQKPTTEATKPSTEPTTTTKPEETTTETTTPESTTTQPPASSTETKEDKAKKDTVTLLKDKSGNQMYLLNSSGNYVEAKYADYYGSNVTFYKKVTTSSYKYTGWQNIDGKTYFYTKDGEPVKGEQVIQGAKYTFGTDGALMTSSGTLGIDVSKWNGNIDWNAVKNSGISYVIIRCGYRGSTTGAMIEDPKFKTNIQGALNAGLKVGIYFFSQAVNEVEAVEEASMTIGLIKKYNISYPVFLDVEASGGRADGIDRNTRTQVIKAFCETIKNSGYTPGVYANKTWLNSYINAGEINSYKIWLAQYNTAPTYSGKFDMWQYSSKGQVSGISGHTDMNLSYMGY